MSTVGQALGKIVVNPPASVRRIEDEYLRSLPPFRSRRVLPIAIAGIKPAGMRGEYPHFRPAHEAARAVP